MDASLLGIVLDSSVLIAAERRKLTPADVIENVQRHVGEVPIVLCSLTVAEIAGVEGCSPSRASQLLIQAHLRLEEATAA